MCSARRKNGGVHWAGGMQIFDLKNSLFLARWLIQDEAGRWICLTKAKASLNTGNWGAIALVSETKTTFQLSKTLDTTLIVPSTIFSTFLRDKGSI